MSGWGRSAGSLADVGIDDDFIKRTRSEITPGTSALFLLSSNAIVDKLRDRFASTSMTLVESNLSDDQEDKRARSSPPDRQVDPSPIGAPSRSRSAITPPRGRASGSTR